MFARWRNAADTLRAVAVGFDPAVITGDQAESLVQVCTEIERLAASVRTLAATRAADARVWKRAGFRSANQWLASTTGTTTGHAHRTLTLGARLQRHAATRAAYQSGRLSDTQAGIVADAADDNPRAETDLLATAQTETVTQLKREAARAKSAAGDDESRQKKIHRGRYARGGDEPDGSYRGSFRFARAQGAVFDTIWQRFERHVFDEARRRGERLAPGQASADALVLMAQTALERLTDPTATAAGGGFVLPGVTLHLLLDHDAFQRGRALPGETCEIDGHGPVTVADALALAGPGAFVTAATVDRRGGVHRVAHLGTTDPRTLTPDRVHDALATAGVDVQTIRGSGRQVPAHLDTALLIRDRVCVEPGCDQRHRLERDHVIPFALGGPTTYANLARRCPHHHRRKTSGDLRTIRIERGRRREARRDGPATPPRRHDRPPAHAP